MDRPLDDKTYINRNTYLQYANTNEELPVLPLRSVVLEIPGLCHGDFLPKVCTAPHNVLKSAILSEKR